MPVRVEAMDFQAVQITEEDVAEVRSAPPHQRNPEVWLQAFDQGASWVVIDQNTGDIRSFPFMYQVSADCVKQHLDLTSGGS